MEQMMTESLYRGLALAELEREYNPASNIANVGELHARRRARCGTVAGTMSSAPVHSRPSGFSGEKSFQR